MRLRLKHRFVMAIIVLLVSLCSLVTMTFAWYIYQTEVRTSDIEMAVGAGNMLQISNQYDGEYSYSALMDKFEGKLTPVSTNRITGGFQKVHGFVKGKEAGPKLLAHFFGPGDTTDYYKTTLYLKGSGSPQDIYLANIGYEDSDAKNPISTAIRIGLVVHEAGKDKAVKSEYIFAINSADNPAAEYNTSTGEDGYVLDCTKTDGTTIPMKNLYNSENFCEYDKKTGIVTLKENSTPLFRINEDGNAEPVQVDVYIWLEGCDKDCTINLCDMMLKNIALSFAGKVV